VAWTLKFPLQIKKDFESSYGLKMKLIFPTPDPFLGEAKKVLACPSRILFFSERKRF
jgi:hypothetical protein